MKKIKSLFLVIICFMFIPMSLVLSSCTFSTDVRNVNSFRFVSEKYDKDTGYAIFEVELNTPTKLTYEINPSNWHGKMLYTMVLNSIEDEDVNYCTLHKTRGEITITDERFDSMIITVEFPNIILEDESILKDAYCIVKLKK